MLSRKEGRENPLHIAVINNDIEKARSLAANSELVIEQNDLGYSALELAQYLQRVEIINILTLSHRRDIKIVLVDETAVRRLSPQEFERIFQVRYLEHLHFHSYNAFKAALRDCPILKRLPFFCREEKILGRELQIELMTGQTADMVIRWIDNTLGYGLFVETALEPGAFIGEYTGVVRKINRFHSDSNEYCFQYPSRFSLFNYHVIDSLREGNILRFLNHSDIPNLKPVCVVDRNLVHVVLIAKRKIKKGEQLTFDYGKDYWKRRRKI